MTSQVEYKSFSELDYQNIKDLLKNHLKTQDILKDFNFEGSTINVILNLLAYNNQYMAYYLNMLASEKFISTAQKRESIVGAANNIGYVPYSKKSSTALLSFTIIPDAGYTSSIFIPKNVRFTTNIGGVSYSFSTTKNTTIIPISGVYTVINLEVKEGRHFLHKFTIQSSDKFLTIPNKGLDYNRLLISVKESSTSNSETIYSKYTTLTNLSSSSPVYFLQEGIGSLYQIYFGDGILGKAISTGNLVSVEYYTTNGALANDATSFVLDDEVTGLASIIFTNNTKSSGGASEESNDSIRLSAPTNYQAQNRAIIETDFEILVKQIYPDAKQVSVIGGEKVTPPQYGKVFISILKNSLDILSDKDKSSILLELNNKYSGLTVFPSIIDPYIIRILINVEVKYNNSAVSESELKTQVFNTIKSFTSIDLNSFKYTLRKSKFESMIDNSNSNILSNTTRLKLYIDTGDVILTSQTNLINFSQPIKIKSLTSSIFTYLTITNCQFIDMDGLGFASIYKKSTSGDLILIQKNALSIDYVTGIIKYVNSSNNFKNLSLENYGSIRVIIETLNDDIIVKANDVIYTKDEDITIITLADS